VYVYRTEEGLNASAVESICASLAASRAASRAASSAARRERFFRSHGEEEGRATSND
jgi:hypothetical protein